MGHLTTTEINYEELTQIFYLVYIQIIYLWFSYEKTGLLTSRAKYCYLMSPGSLLNRPMAGNR